MTDKRRYSDRAEYLKQAVANRRRNLKAKALEYKGNKCQICEYGKYVGALEFHHLDPAQKDFGIGYKGYTRSWIVVKKELDKCILVCSNCHHEIHGGHTQPPQVIADGKRGELLEA
jgi:predicted HNH restriction endonuclease